MGDAGIVPEWYETPVFSFTNPYAITGPYDDIPVTPGSTVLDYELEVGAVIGLDGFNLTPEAARDTSLATRSSTTGRRVICGPPK